MKTLHAPLLLLTSALLSLPSAAAPDPDTLAGWLARGPLEAPAPGVVPAPAPAPDPGPADDATGPRDDLFGAPLDPDAPPGVYTPEGPLRGVVPDPSQSLTLLLRPLIERHRVLTVRLDPRETYFFAPFGRQRNLSLGGRTLTIEAAGSNADGRVRIDVRPDPDGGFSNTFWVHRSATANLRLRAVDLVCPDRPATAFVDGINLNGRGRLEVLDSNVAGFRNNLSCDFNDSDGMSVLVDRSGLLYAFAPDRDAGHPETGEGGPSNGMYLRNYADLCVRDSVIHHNGWREGGAEATWGSPYSHGFYLQVGAAGTADPQRTRIEGNLFSAPGSHAAQLRNGGVFRGNLLLDCPFGVSLPVGEVVGNAFVANAYCWPRDGVVRPGDYERWEDRGDRPIDVDHRDHGGSPLRNHGPVRVGGNAFADAPHPGARAPIARAADEDTPGTVDSAGNAALNWNPFEMGTPLNPAPGLAPVPETADDAAAAETAATRALLDAALSRPRGSRPDVSGRVDAYLRRAGL